MVKRQKEKQYLSAREQRTQGYARANTTLNAHQLGSVQRRLPFDCCALTLVPFTDPVCTTSSHVVFDNAALMEFVLKHKRDPVTGDEMSILMMGGNKKKDSDNMKKKKTPQIIRLNMDRDSEGRWQCPVLTKPFSNQTKIVAVIDRNGGSGDDCGGSSGTLEANVYSYEVYKELNEKNKNWIDLTTGNKFSPKKDVIVLNDPNDDKLQQRRDIQTFWHIQNARSIDMKGSGTAGSGGSGSSDSTKSITSGNVRHSVTATRIMEKIEKERQEKKRQLESTDSSTTSAVSKKGRKILAQDVTGISLTSGKAATSLTSTAMDVAYDNPLREATTEEVLQSKFKIMKSRKDEKGYVRLKTNMGDMLVELHCDIVPRTCYNFLGLCRENKYDGASFHRLIPNFMIQCKSTKTEESYFGGPAGFVDEFDDRLKHSGPAILSMANSGRNTNKNQFFITFKACPHLDRKHSVFGEVVDDAKDATTGIGTLQRMQSVGKDEKDRPVKPITLLSTEIVVDPALEAEEIQEKKFDELASAREQSTQKQSSNGAKPATTTTTAGSTKTSKVGKYLNVPSTDVLSGTSLDIGSSFTAPSKTKKSQKAPASKKNYGNFSNF